MNYSIENSITIKFDDREVDDFLKLISVSFKEIKRPGYKKRIPRDLHDFVISLHEEFLGDDIQDQDE